MPRPALYYPYIHIRSEQWLKATLLCVPTVKRIVPQDYTPEDEPAIKQYTTITGPHGALLQAVPAYTPAAYNAQQRLRKSLVEHAATINRKFDRSHAPISDEYWIHTAKFTDELLEYLTANNLAWHSHHSKAYGHRTWYALHPVLGRAIMTTLGLSIADEQRYDIVTADGMYHEALLATREDEVFEALLEKKTSEPVATSAQTRQELAQLVITLTGVNYEALRPERIPELQASTRFQEFQRILRESASTIDREGGPEAYDSQLREEAQHIVSSWQDTKHDLSKDLREVLFGGVMLGTEALRTLMKGPEPIEAAIVGGVAVWRLVDKARQVLKRRGSPHQYLTEIVDAQDTFLQLMFPLGLEA